MSVFSHRRTAFVVSLLLVTATLPATPRATGKPGAPVVSRAPISKAAPGPSAAARATATAPALTLEECLQFALENHPSLRQARGSWSVARARLRGSRANWLPQLTLSLSESKTELFRQSASGGAVAQGGVVIGTGSSRTVESDIKRASLNLRQTLTDFGRTDGKVSAARHGAAAAGFDLENSAQDVVLAVEEAYFNLLAARRLLAVNRDQLQRFQAHVELARGFVEVGKRPRFDLTKALVDLSNARVSLISAENALKVARVTLANAMGLQGELPAEPADRLPSVPPQLSREDALATGQAQRRDLRSLGRKLSGAKASLSAARAGYRPTLSMGAGKTLRGEDFPLDRESSLTLSLDWNLFDGQATKASVQEARAQIEIVSGQYDALLQKVVLDIGQQHLNVAEAQARLEATRVTLAQARENLDLARGRYAEGVGSPIEVTDAEASLTSAEGSNVKALYDLEIALARLERAMGLIQVQGLVPGWSPPHSSVPGVPATGTELSGPSPSEVIR